MAKILIVDDEMSILIMLQAILQGAGHDVISCNDGTKALEMLKAPKFDLMITDVRMEPVDGIQLLKKAVKCKPALPTILVTAFELPTKNGSPSDLGAAGYLRKPFRYTDLLDCVNKVLVVKENKEN